MVKDDSHFRLRIPADLKARIEEAASESRRSMNAEIIARLEESFNDGAIALAQRVAEIDEIVGDHVKDIAELWIHIETLQAYALRDSLNDDNSMVAADAIRKVKERESDAGGKGRTFKLPKKRKINLDGPENEHD